MYPPVKGKPLTTPTAHNVTQSKRYGLGRGRLKAKSKKPKATGQKMAIGRISIKSGSKGKGLAHAKYILREDKYAPKADKLEKLESVGHGNMPSWAKENPKFLWEMADEHERKNGSVYREHIIALPREMTEQQRHDLVQDWIKQEIGDKHPYSYAIHNPLAMDGKEQPHCHLMICERTLDGIDRGADQFFKRYNSKDPTKGGAKKANTGLDHATRKEQIKQQRERWGQLCNKHLERIGSRERVDMRNYKERGVTKPQNISMSDMLKPEIKQAYKDKLTSRADLKHALFERVKTVGNPTKALADIEQRPKPQEIKKQSELTAVSEPSPQPKTQKPLETHSKRLEPQENNSARVVPQLAEKSPQSENKPNIEPKKINLAEKQQLIKEYAEKVHTTAKAILDSQLKALREKAKPLLEKFENLRDNKPKSEYVRPEFMGKSKWAIEKDEAQTAYSNIKITHDNLKEKGVTDDHYKQAREYIAKHEPSYHAQVQQAIKDLENHHQEQQNQKAREHGADIYAQKGKSYRGEIVRADDKGILQQTKDGIVYHPPMQGIEQGKSYTLTNKGDHYQTQENYEIKAPSKSQEHDKGISR